MTLIWTPNGQLDIATDPSDLPFEGDGSNLSSGAMQRLKNLDLDQLGKAILRRGISRVDGGETGRLSIFLAASLVPGSTAESVVNAGGGVGGGGGFFTPAGGSSSGQNVDGSSTGGSFDNTSESSSAGGTGPSFATFNPSDKQAGVTLSDSDLTMTGASGGGRTAGCVRSTIGVTSGKYYWESLCNTLETKNGAGISTAAHTLTQLPGDTATSWAYYRQTATAFLHNSTNTGPQTAYGATDVIMIALDMDNGMIWWGLNGTWGDVSAQTDPANALNPAYSNVLTVAGANPVFALNGVSDDQGGTAGSYTNNFGASIFAFPAKVPAGFTAGLSG